MTEEPPQVEAPQELYRPKEGRMLTGVCAGLGRFAGIDPILFRVAVALLVVASGTGIFLYVAAWLLMREEDGGPSHMEQWTRRSFDAQTVLALLTGVLAIGMVMNLGVGGLGSGAIVVGTLLAVGLLAAHARGFDLRAFARSLPERLTGKPLRYDTSPPPKPQTQAPFSPHGPYGTAQPKAPEAKPYTPGQTKKRTKSYVGGLTMWIALIVGGIMLAVQSKSGTANLPMIGAAVLVTIGVGLVIATWFGRGAGLVVAGTAVSVALMAGSAATGIPKRIGNYNWTPTDVSQASGDYRVGLGEGRLDLTKMTLPAGVRTKVHAAVGVGEIQVIVPRNARIEVRAVTRLGDIMIDGMLVPGNVVQRVITAEPGKGDAPIIELRVEAGFGDVVVKRAAA